MAASDARPVPIKGTAYRAVFPIVDSDGDLVTGAAGLDSEVSKDQGAFADCTNEATEIATSSGMYYLDITSTEMNADCVAVIVKTSTTDAKTSVLVLYPQETGDILVSVETKTGFSLASSGIDLILVESGISAGAGLTNDTGTQLTSINARQALALIASACAGVLSGAATTDIDVKPAGKPAGNTRIDAAVVDANGNRSTVNLKVPD